MRKIVKGEKEVNMTRPNRIFFTERGEALEAMTKKRGRVLTMCSEELRDDEQLVRKALQFDGSLLRLVSARLRNDRETVRLAVAQHGPAIQYALGEKIEFDFELARLAVEQDWRALEHVSDTLRADKDIVAAALRSSGHALAFASDYLRGNKAFCLSAVTLHGEAFAHVKDHLKNDREIVLKSVQENGDVLALVPSVRHREDPEVVAAAVNENGFSLQHAASAVQWSGFRSDHVEIVEAAMNQRMAAVRSEPASPRKGFVDADRWGARHLG